MQYESERLKDPIIWPAMYEDKYCIANNALECYVAADKEFGQQRVEAAWIAAKEGRVSLPPIIASNRF